MAVGVANPKAQGQAITSTARAAENARSGPAPVSSHTAAVTSCDDEDHRDEHPSDAIGQPLRIGLLRLCLLNQADHSRELGVGADCGSFDDEPPVEHDGAPDHACTRVCAYRFGLAGHRTHVDRRSTLDHQAVGGDGLPGPNDEALLLFEFVGGNDHLGAAGQ